MKRDGTFSIQVLGDKDIIIHQSDCSYERLYEDDTVSDLAKLAIRGECSDLLIATAGLCSASSQPITASKKPKLDFASVIDHAVARKTDISGISEQTTPNQSSMTDSTSAGGTDSKQSDVDDNDTQLDNISGVV